MNKHPLDTIKQPWVSFPYVISWWDMEQFSAEKFYQLGKHLGEIDKTLDSLLLETGMDRDDASTY